MNKVSRSRKGVLRKIVLLIGIIFVIFVSIIFLILLTQKPENLQVSNVDLSRIKDGVYIGNADNGLVKAKVSVEVKNGTILDISIIKHEQMLGKKAEIITDSIIAQQSLDVDAITSATYSSNTIRKAVENALSQGE